MTNTNVISCLYDILNIAQAGKWADDGEITLNRPPANTKLEKIKFRSFSANIKNSLQGLQIPVIYGRLTATIQQLLSTKNGLSTEITNGVKAMFNYTTSPTLHITNQKGTTDYTMNKSNFLNNSFLLEEYTTPVVSSFSDSVNTLLEQSRYELINKLGIIDNNNVSANEQATRFYTGNVNPPSGYLFDNNDFKQHGLGFGYQTTQGSWIAITNTWTNADTLTDYQTRMVQYADDSTAINVYKLQDMFTDRPNFIQAYDGLLYGYGGMVSANAKDPFDFDIGTLYSDSCKVSNYRGVIIGKQATNDSSNFVIIDYPDINKSNVQQCYTIDWLYNHTDNLTFLTVGYCGNGSYQGVIKWSTNTISAALHTQLGNFMDEHEYEQCYCIQMRFYPVVNITQNVKSIILNPMFIYKNTSNNKWYVASFFIKFTMPDTAYDNIFVSFADASNKITWIVKDTIATANGFNITIQPNQLTLSEASLSETAINSSIDPSYLFNMLATDQYLYAINKLTTNQNLYSTIISYLDSEGRYNEADLYPPFTITHTRPLVYYTPIESPSADGLFVIHNDIENEIYRIWPFEEVSSTSNWMRSCGIELSLIYACQALLSKNVSLQQHITSTTTCSIINQIPGRIPNNVYTSGTFIYEDGELNTTQSVYYLIDNHGYYVQATGELPDSSKSGEYNICLSSLTVDYDNGVVFKPYLPFINENTVGSGYMWSMNEGKHINNVVNSPYIYSTKYAQFVNDLFTIDEDNNLISAVLPLYYEDTTENTTYLANLVFSLDIYTDPEVFEYSPFAQQLPIVFSSEQTEQTRIYYNTTNQVVNNQPSLTTCRIPFEDYLFIQNQDYYNTLSAFLLLNNTDMTLRLISDVYPTLNNIVFYLNETSMIDFKETTAAPSEPNVKCKIIDSNGETLTPSAAKTIYSNITICVDWEFAK